MLPVLLFLVACTHDPTTVCEACTSCLEEEVQYATGAHVGGGIDYDDRPPAGGDHDPCWADWGVHDEEVPDEQWVHNLEHGGVVFLYSCPDGCPDELATLTALVEARPDTTLLSPYSLMDTPFAAVAWEHRLLLDCVDESTLVNFYDRHQGQAPESSTAMAPEGC